MGGETEALKFAYYLGCKSLRDISGNKWNRRQYGLSESAMLKKLEQLAGMGIINEVRDGNFREDEVLEAANKYKAFMTGNVKDLRALLAQMKPEPDAIGQETVPAEPITHPDKDPEPSAPLGPVEDAKLPPAPTVADVTPALKKADTDGIGEERLALLRDEAGEILANHRPEDYASMEEFMLEALCALERKGIINGGPQTIYANAPFYVEMLPHAEYVPIRASREFTEFERDIFRMAEKMADAVNGAALQSVDIAKMMPPLLESTANRQMGKVFVTKWTRRMAKDMGATEMSPLDGEPDYRITTVALRTMTTSVCRIICGIERRNWWEMKKYLKRNPAPEPMADVPAPQPHKAKRPYRRKNADFYSSDEEIAADHKSHKFRTKAILEVVRGLEEAGEIRKTGGTYQKAETREKLKGFLERHCGENEVVAKISRKFGLTVSGARTKLDLFKKSHKKRVEGAMKHGAYDREAMGELLESHRSVFEKYSGSRREERRQKKAAQRKAKETDARRGRKLIRAAIGTIEKLEGMKEAQRKKLNDAMDCDVFAALRTAKRGLAEGCGFVPRDQFRALLGIGNGVKESGIQLGRLGITPEDIENIAYIAKAKLAREGPSIQR